MEKYFLLQCKRISRSLPGAALAALILLSSLLAIFQLMVRQNAQDETNNKFEVAMVGYTDDTFLQMGLTALTAFDSSRFSLDIRQMDEAAAKRLLSAGEIAAYVVVPENFIDEAMKGNILPLKFVSTTGAAGLVSIFKDEVTVVISQILLSAQRGVFGMWDAALENGCQVGSYMDEMSIRYTEYVFARDKFYTLTELGISDKLGMEEYLLFGLCVLLLFLCCLPFAPMMIRKDLALPQMLAAKGRTAFRQNLCDFTVYFLALLLMVLVLLIPVSLLMGDAFDFWSILLACVPVLLMITGFSYCLYSLSTGLIDGVLIQFFTALCMCFVSGCMYPVHFFPVQVQRIARWLPAGLARSQLSLCVTKADAGLTPLWLLAYGLGFFLIGHFVSAYRIKGVHK